MRRILVAAVALLLAAPAPTEAPVAAAAGAPNILVILTDDQRPGTLGPLDQVRRWFRRGGTEYPNAIATTPVCCPSRATVMSGRYAHNHGVLNNRSAEAFDQDASLQRLLRDGGYRTGIVGKFLNEWPLEEDPLHFDDWAIFSSSAVYRGQTWNVHGRVQVVPEYTTTFLKRRALRFLEASEREDTRPWFLLLTPAAPHDPAIPERRDRRARVGGWAGNPANREEDRSDKPPYIQERLPARTRSGAMRRQLRSLLSVDRMVGEVLGRMAALGETDTLAFFLSDNGYLLGEHGWIGKGVPYRASTGIPFLARWPGHVSQGEVNRSLVGTLDVAPTALDAAGIPVPPEMDGRSLFEAPARGDILAEFWGVGGPVPTWAALRRDGDLYVEYEDESGVVTFREYYDLVTDPWQLRNLLGDADPANDPLDLPALSARLRALRSCSGTSGATACS